MSPKLWPLVIGLLSFLIISSESNAWSPQPPPKFIGKSAQECLQVLTGHAWEDFGEWVWSQSPTITVKNTCSTDISLKEFKLIKTNDTGIREEISNEKYPYATLIHHENEKAIVEKFKYSAAGKECAPPLKDDLPLCKTLLVPPNYFLTVVVGYRPLILRGTIGKSPELVELLSGYLD